jgi:putative ABC transport system permease protein
LIYPLIICAVLIVLTFLAANYLKLGIEKDIIIGFVRALIQVIILSFIILKLFQLSNIFTFLALFIMAFFGTLTAYHHGKFLKKSFFITFISIYISSFSIILIMFISKVIENKAQIILPLGGMVIGNAMNSVSLAFDRLKGELKDKNLLIETMLGLGLPSRLAYNKIKIPCIKVAMLPKINNMKSLGLVWIPGLMAGMILGGANPVKAAIYQLIIITMIVVSSFIASLIVVEISRYQVFNKFDQINVKII